MRKKNRSFTKPFNLYLLLVMLFLSTILKAQPGWQDRTPRYNYAIVDENGKEISFKNNKDYTIIIDKTLYKSPDIPQDVFKQPGPHQDLILEFKINDLSLSIPMKENNWTQYSKEIKIIYKKDTMHISQPSGYGSLSMFRDFGETTADYTLQFIAGHYYFPNWTKDVLNDIPETKGNTKILNLSQRHFIVPKKVYDTLFHNTSTDPSSEKADELVLKNFMKGYFSLNKKIELTKFDKSVSPFKLRYLNSMHINSKDPNLLYGLINYSMEKSNCSSSINIFSILNKKQNTVQQFFPKKNVRFFSSDQLISDNFNHILYLSVWLKKDFDDDKLSDCDYLSQFPLEKQIYTSTDEVNNWIVDKKIQSVFVKNDFREVEFLDQNHAIAYSRKTSKQNPNKNEMVQGIYYLLKNMQIVDSLKTPEDIHYNTNYNNYAFNKKNNDTIFLGSWTYDNDYTIGKTKYFQPSLIKTNDSWKFHSEEKTYQRYAYKPQKKTETSKEYKNFQLVNDKELIFKNGSGSLKLSSNVTDHISDNENFILEKDQQIYIFSDRDSLYFSHDAGTNWFLYPVPLEKWGNVFYFLDINEQNELVYFSTRGDQGGDSVLGKVSQKFKLEKKDVK
ncbi:hypothetical protein [Chryseobacterium sp. 5_R23647]|uniref:hypothetical protein n=1 Tax=Chryseobacterium sp. 5_R23647 TaxID=2258964 RepID=UPI000F4E5DFF|nr:hypothetical protein [Chryseobacterium sp. 5_R23647]